MADCAAILAIGSLTIFWASSYAWKKMRLQPVTFVICLFAYFVPFALFVIAAVLDVYQLDAYKPVFLSAVAILLLAILGHGLLVYWLWRKTINIEKKTKQITYGRRISPDK
jgi:hypothetical protein